MRIYELVDGSRWVHKTLQKKEKIVGFHFQSGNDSEMTYCPLNKTHPPRLSGSDFIDVKSSDDARKLRLQPCSRVVEKKRKKMKKEKRKKDQINTKKKNELITTEMKNMMETNRRKN